jgi:hypothetical protein
LDCLEGKKKKKVIKMHIVKDSFYIKIFVKINEEVLTQIAEFDLLIRKK